MNGLHTLNKEAAIEYISRYAQEDSVRKTRLLAKDLYKDIVEAGVDEHIAARVLKRRITQHVSACAAGDEFKNTVSDVLHMVEVAAARGKDNLGRLIVKFAMKDRPDGRVLYSVGHELDVRSREEFVPDVISRPVLQLFLVSMRGSIDGLEPFRSVPMLFGTDLSYLTERNAECDFILRSHCFEMGGAHFVDWNKVYNDPRAKELALIVISELLMKISEMGLDHFQKILENLQGKAERATGRKMMKRRVCGEDVSLLFTVLADSLRHLNVKVD